MIILSQCDKCGLEEKDKFKRKEVIDFVDYSFFCRSEIVKAIEFLKMKEEANII